MVPIVVVVPLILVGFLLGMLFVLFNYPTGAHYAWDAWVADGRRLQAAAVRATYLQDAEAERRARADLLAHDCMRPDPTLWQRLTGRQS